jgi:hypothetical protein
MARDVMILMRATSIARAIGKGWALKIGTFLGPEMATSCMAFNSLLVFLPFMWQVFYYILIYKKQKTSSYSYSIIFASCCKGLRYMCWKCEKYSVGKHLYLYGYVVCVSV